MSERANGGRERQAEAIELMIERDIGNGRTELRGIEEVREHLRSGRTLRKTPRAGARRATNEDAVLLT